MLFRSVQDPGEIESPGVVLAGNESLFPSPQERIEMARRHTHLLADRHPKAVVRMRKHACWYVKGIPGAAAARGTFNACTTAEDFDKAFDDMLAHLLQHDGKRGSE